MEQTKEFALTLDDRPGTLAKATDAIAKAGINIEGYAAVPSVYPRRPDPGHHTASWRRESNPRPRTYHARALPTELLQHSSGSAIW